MSLDPEQWTKSSNEALQISLAESEGVFSFHPAFTYPIFGEAEQIFGYKDLKMALAFDSKSLLPLLSVSYSEKLENDEVPDVKAKLLEVLPKETVTSGEEDWLAAVEKDDFNIPGEPIRTYKRGDDEFTVYKASITEAHKLHLRIQVFVLLFIEAASYIDDEDPVWELYLVYKTSGTKPSFVGFSTVYSYWYFESAEKHDAIEQKKNDTLDLKTRKKISQFVILPPYQQKGNGAELYSAIVDQCLQDGQVVEMCVEDPSEQFDDLRDRCDLERLYREGLFNEDNGFKPGIDITAWIAAQRPATKLEKRQFARLVEMAMLQNKFPGKEVRLKIKRRLYVKNKDSLVELDEPTRKDKLQTAFQRLEEDYLRILGKVRFGSKKRKIA